MARRRDYKAEELRRNQLAREHGFSSRAAERGAKKRQDFKKAGFRSHEAYVKARQAARRQSEARSKSPRSAFKPTMTASQFKSHRQAFVKKHTSHETFLRDLAEDLHGQEPEEYPEYEGNEQFWHDY